MSPLVLTLVAAVVTGVGGLLVPTMIRVLPEPQPREGDEPKTPYAEIAARPGLRWRAAAASALAGGSVAWAVGPDWWLLVLLPVVVVCVALAVVDWHTKLLPTRLVLPATAYALLAAITGAVVTRDPDDLVRGLIGLVAVRSVFWLLWRIHSAGMGFGDVRLAALLGISLGHLGWSELVVGAYTGFLIFGLPGLLLALVRRDRTLLRTAFPFGPFMVVGALIGVLAGPWLADLAFR